MRCLGLALLGAVVSAAPLRSQTASADTMAAAVVQRFVDAANAADVSAMMTTIAPEAAFGTLPGGQPLAIGRDSVLALYARMFARQAGTTIKVESRLADGAFTVDHEHFLAPDGKPQGHATWFTICGGRRARAAFGRLEYRRSDSGGLGPTRRPRSAGTTAAR